MIFSHPFFAAAYPSSIRTLEDQLTEDIEDLRAIFEFKGIPFDEEVDLIGYEGANVASSMLGDDGIQLNPNELILFD